MKIMVPHDPESPAYGGIPYYSQELIRALMESTDFTIEVDPPHTGYKILGRERLGYVANLWKNQTHDHGIKTLHATDIKRLHKHTNVLTIHDLSPLKLPDTVPKATRLLWRLMRKRIENVPIIITPTKAVKREVLREYERDPETIRAIHHGVNHNHWYEDPNPMRLSQYRDYHVMAVGDWNPRKQWHELITALGKSDLKITLNHVGTPDRNPYYHRCRQTAWKYGLPLREWGNVTTATLRRLYTAMDLVAYPSRLEGFGFPPLEAAACGTPSVLTDTEVMREVMGDAAYYVPVNPREPQPWCSPHEHPWTSLLENALKVPISQGALMGKVLTHPTWEDTAKETLIAYSLSDEGGI